MRWILLSASVCGMVTLAGPAPLTTAAGAVEADAAPVHPSSTTVKHDLTTVIDAQLAAFRAEDYPKAYTFAAAEIKGVLGVAEFEVMVKRGYPVIARSATAEYGLAFDTGDQAVVNVRVVDENGKGVEYQYVLKKEGGRWRIGGVVEMASVGGLTV